MSGRGLLEDAPPEIAGLGVILTLAHSCLDSAVAPPTEKELREQLEGVRRVAVQTLYGCGWGAVPEVYGIGRPAR